MSGFQEILLIVIILLAIFFIPRMTARNAESAARGNRPSLRPAHRRRFPPEFSVGQRLAILASVIWFCGALLYFRPWAGDWVLFGAIGGLPLIIAWGLYWVFAGDHRQGPPFNRRPPHPMNRRR
jgi:hypothetical protein